MSWSLRDATGIRQYKASFSANPFDDALFTVFQQTKLRWLTEIATHDPVSIGVPICARFDAQQASVDECVVGQLYGDAIERRRNDALQFGATRRRRRDDSCGPFGRTCG
jgi:hypothetical protein